ESPQRQNMVEKGNPFIVGVLILGNIIILVRRFGGLGSSGVHAPCGPPQQGLTSSLLFSPLPNPKYLVLMLIVYIFECASCITSYTHRDFVVSNHRMVTKQMLTFYAAPTAQGRELTRMWDRIMMEQQCCGATGPLDWVNHTSTFRSFYPEGLAPWPFLCCKRDANFVILSPEGCRVGHVDYINTKGCFEHIENAVNSYTWGISWFGFAILMFTCPVMLLAMYHYTTL
uniref:Uroplakin 1A n=1 Tax=Chelonoidis abingdonii TaxID=106734 RepID=A0A8C0HA04_CHEAB